MIKNTYLNPVNTVKNTVKMEGRNKDGTFAKGNKGKKPGTKNHTTSRKKLQKIFDDYMYGDGEISFMNDLKEIKPTDRARLIQAFTVFHLPKLNHTDLNTINEERAKEWLDDYLSK